MTASHIRILLAPFAIELTWIVLFAILPWTTSPRPLSVPESPPDIDLEDEYDDEDDAPAELLDRAWKRWLWLAYVLYHFPVVVPTSLLRKDDKVPGWLLRSVTPVLYAGILYLLFVRR